MSSQSKIEWTDATTFIIDREGRRVRTYQRKNANRPGTQQRRHMLAKGLKWCSACKEWLPDDKVTQRGLCRPHANELYRYYYAHGGKLAIAQRAHARKRHISPVPPLAQEMLLEHFQGKCAYCLVREATTWDHIIPVAKGGTTTPGNIVPACVSCNSSKNAKDVTAWLISKNIPMNETLLEIMILAEVLPYEHYNH